VSSGIADFLSMTLRIGFGHCYEHVTGNEVSTRVGVARSIVDIARLTVIFYDIELSKDGQIEQLSAFTETGESFSTYIRTSVRTNSSPALKSIPPWVYNALATEPKDAMKSLISWIEKMHSMNTNGDTNMNNVILAAHFGSCHDHVHLLRTMMMWGIKPPVYRLSDTLPLFKLTVQGNGRANLPSLIAKYTPWVTHMAHDADSDTNALRCVVMTVFPETRMACFAFSTSHRNFMSITGLDMYKLPTASTFPGEICKAETDSTWNESTYQPES